VAGGGGFNSGVKGLMLTSFKTNVKGGGGGGKRRRGRKRSSKSRIMQQVNVWPKIFKHHSLHDVSE